MQQEIKMKNHPLQLYATNVVKLTVLKFIEYGMLSKLFVISKVYLKQQQSIAMTQKSVMKKIKTFYAIYSKLRNTVIIS